MKPHIPIARLAVILACLMVLLLSTPSTLGQGGCLNRCLQNLINCAGEASPSTNCENDYDICVEVCLLEMQ